MDAAEHCSTLQHATTRYNTLQRAATQCNALQHTAPHCNALQHTNGCAISHSCNLSGGLCPSQWAQPHTMASRRQNARTMKRGRVRMRHTNKCQGGCWHSRRALKKSTAQYEFSETNSSCRSPAKEIVSRKFGKVQRVNKRPCWWRWRSITRPWPCLTAHKTSSTWRENNTAKSACLITILVQVCVCICVCVCVLIHAGAGNSLFPCHASISACANVCVDAAMYVGEDRRARGRTGVAPITLTHVSTCTTHALVYSQMPMMRCRPRQCPPAEPWYPSLAVTPSLQQPPMTPKLMLILRMIQLLQWKARL